MSGLDWIHSGLELGTYMQVTKTQRELSNLASTIENAIEVESAEKAVLLAKRNFIFDLVTELQELETQVNSHPLIVFVLTKIRMFHLSESGITYHDFPEFQEKQFFLDLDSASLFL